MYPLGDSREDYNSRRLPIHFDNAYRFLDCEYTENWRTVRKIHFVASSNAFRTINPRMRLRKTKVTTSLPPRGKNGAFFGNTRLGKILTVEKPLSR